MGAKPYNNDDEQQISVASEPATVYGSGNVCVQNVNLNGSLSESKNDDVPEWFEAKFVKLKAEADEKYGAKEQMSVDEYFGKLTHIVDGIYENLPSQN